jgi:hypothetical protein
MQFTNMPKPCSFEDYEKAIKEYIQSVRRFGKGVSVCQVGDVGVPGISDIDLFVFIDEQCFGDFSAYSHVTDLGRYLFMHDVYPLPEAMARDVGLITSIFNVKHRHGRHLISSTPRYSDMETILFLNDIVIVSLAHEYEQWKDSAVMNARLALARVNSLKYPIHLVSNLVRNSGDYGIDAGELSNLKEFVRKFSEFRSAFFSFEPTEAADYLTRYLTDAASIAKDLMRIIEIVNSNQEWFRDDLSSASFEYYNTSLSSSAIATSMFCNLYAYGRNANGPISKIVQENSRFSGTVRYADEYNALLQRRIKLLDDATKFRRERGFRYGVLWPFGFVESRTIRQRITSRIKKIYSYVKATLL